MAANVCARDTKAQKYLADTFVQRKHMVGTRNLLPYFNFQLLALTHIDTRDGMALPTDTECSIV